MKTTHTLVAVALLMQEFHAWPLQRSKPRQTRRPLHLLRQRGKEESLHPVWLHGELPDIKVQEDSTDDPVDGRHCTKITVKSSNTQGAGWLGVYYQNPPNNWGTRKGGYDLSSHKRLTFWARSETDNVVIDTFKVEALRVSMETQTQSKSQGPS